MKADNVDVFIAYKDIQLPEGKHKVTIVFSAENEIKSLPDFYDHSFTFDQIAYTVYPFSEQEFVIKNFRMNFNSGEFMSEKKGVNAEFDLSVRYGVDNVNEESYTLRWQFRDENDKIVFDSEDASSIFYTDELVMLSNFEAHDEGASYSNVNLYTEYDDLKAFTGETGYFVIIASAKGAGQREIFNEEIENGLPERYYFKEQEFEIVDMMTEPSIHEGVHGIEVTFEAFPKYTGLLMDEHLDDAFHFYPKLYHNGSLVYKAAGMSHHWKTRALLSDNMVASVEPLDPFLRFFIPYHHINLKEGSYELTMELHVTDKQNSVRMSKLHEITIDVKQPEIMHVDLEIDELKVEGPGSGGYDAFVGSYPDVSWQITLGDEEMYSTGRNKNSLYGYTGQTSFDIVWGEPIELEVWDVDRGIFNRDDLIDIIELDYEDLGKSFTGDIAEGAVEICKIRYSITSKY